VTTLPGDAASAGSKLKENAGIARALYVTAKERVVIVRVSLEKTEKTPTGEIDLALQRQRN
jgi:phage-related protein